MLRETLTAVAQAGQSTLQRVVGARDVRTSVSQVRDWTFALPRLGLVTVANSAVHQIYVGFSQQLLAHLADGGRGPETLLTEFKADLVSRLPARRPIGAWQLLDLGGTPRVLRGLRSFILRQRTAHGNLYLLSDLASRAEYESLREPGWDLALATQVLGGDPGRHDTIVSPATIRRLTSYLLRCEHDLELHLADGPQGPATTRAVVLRRESRADGEQLVVSCDLDRELLAGVAAGCTVEGAFGAAGRVFRFHTRCDGPAPLDLDGVAQLPGLCLEVPGRYELDQRRRYFRIPVPPGVSVRVACVPPDAHEANEPEAGPCPAQSDPGPPEDAAVARVVDLSFSGAGLQLEPGALPDLAVDDVVRLWLDDPETGAPVCLTGVIRRRAAEPVGRGRSQLTLGVEFVVQRREDRAGTTRVRQYVMAQQRSLLADRSARHQPAPA